MCPSGGGGGERDAMEARDAVAACSTLAEACVLALSTPCNWRKADVADALAERWRAGKRDGQANAWRVHSGERVARETPPDVPARKEGLVFVEPGKVKRSPKKGSHAARLALLHSLAHIEATAVDLGLDAIARFGGAGSDMPQEFYDDFVEVAADECRHFRALAARLLEPPYESRYGALEVHDGLWQSATATAGDVRARMAIEHMVHEARGLDVLPSTINKFKGGGDAKTAKLLEEVVYPEEVSHCAAGLRWFCYATAAASQSASPALPPAHPDSHLDAATVEAARQHFLAIVPEYFRGKLKPPFNDEARAKAGFTKSWYEPLSSDAQRDAAQEQLDRLSLQRPAEGAARAAA